MILENEKWALILGGSSGLGLATAQRLAKEGYGLIVVHRDRKTDQNSIDRHFQKIREHGQALHSFNEDATNEAKRKALILAISELLHDQKIKVLVHSIAKGNLKPMHSNTEAVLRGQDFALTINAMATSLYEWTGDLVKQGLFASDTRIIAFTSEGNVKALQGYGAVSAAKASLEAIVRNMALEFAPLGIKANCIQAGLTDTPSFRMIPNSGALIKNALKRNPNNRLTTPEDVADAVYLLTLPEAQWITGTVIKVDGGESLR
ncbi:SDR family oxidoreductase [Allomuricauda sp. SCSIO 65647]|uniref:SDR family oxidoreductase n=1 Tax=Allomuricauda sp. SCSIO 65647 TaxID=2908843 RepID=UPI001F3DBC80|nr:SDR family oxidoreductase [Muricauda sp. SCSIO 65647]UJH67397.1 SDR family oxidoreductase [Muricauda sp. SCSIO 65647]